MQQKKKSILRRNSLAPCILIQEKESILKKRYSMIEESGLKIHELMKVEQ